MAELIQTVTLFSHDFIIFSLILPVLQLKTQQLMTSQIRSYIEYFIQTYNIVVLFLYPELAKI